MNDVVCFQTVYIVCGYTDLRSGMDWLVALVEAQSGNRPYVSDILYFFAADGQTAPKGLYKKGTGGSCWIRGCRKASSNGRAVRKKCAP